MSFVLSGRSRYAAGSGLIFGRTGSRYYVEQDGVLRRLIMTVKLNLIVNDTAIHTDYFVGGFIDHVVTGIMNHLKVPAR